MYAYEHVLMYRVDTRSIEHTRVEIKPSMRDARRFNLLIDAISDDVQPVQNLGTPTDDHLIMFCDL